MKKFGQLRSRGVSVKAAVVAVSVASAAGANAALPAWASGIGEDMTTAVTDAATLVGPVIAAAIVAVVVIKLIKRFSNKI